MRDPSASLDDWRSMENSDSYECSESEEEEARNEVEELGYDRLHNSQEDSTHSDTGEKDAKLSRHTTAAWISDLEGGFIEEILDQLLANQRLIDTLVTSYHENPCSNTRIPRPLVPPPSALEMHRLRAAFYRVGISCNIY